MEGSAYLYYTDFIGFVKTYEILLDRIEYGLYNEPCGRQGWIVIYLPLLSPTKPPQKLHEPHQTYAPYLTLQNPEKCMGFSIYMGVGGMVTCVPFITLMDFLTFKIKFLPFKFKKLCRLFEVYKIYGVEVYL